MGLLVSRRGAQDSGNTPVDHRWRMSSVSKVSLKLSNMICMAGRRVVTCCCGECCPLAYQGLTRPQRHCCPSHSEELEGGLVKLSHCTRENTRQVY